MAGLRTQVMRSAMPWLSIVMLNCAYSLPTAMDHRAIDLKLRTFPPECRRDTTFTIARAVPVRILLRVCLRGFGP